MKALRTERLILRRIQVSDTQRIFDCWASKPEVTQYLTWHAHDSIAQTQQVMAYWLSEYVKPDCYRYGIVCADTDELIGMIDVVGYRAGLPEIGYCSGPAYWGKGYMTEAVKAVTAQLFEEGYPAIDVRAIKENRGSIRVIEKAGFSFVREYEEPQSAGKPGIVTICAYRLEQKKGI